MLKEMNFDVLNEQYLKAAKLYPELNYVTILYDTTHPQGCEVLEGDGEDAGTFIISCMAPKTNNEKDIQPMLKSFTFGLAIIIFNIKYAQGSGSDITIETIIDTLIGD